VSALNQVGLKLARLRLARLRLAGAGLASAALLLAGCSNPFEPVPEPPVQVVANSWGCRDRDMATELIFLGQEHATFENRLRYGLNEGICVLLRPGQTVGVTQKDPMGLVKVRPEKSPVAYWTQAQNVR
jgi:hypothetical protein